ncbi:MAG: ABC transporter substrate-binding protein [Zoogloeaceae bacterium]|jgi:TRAP transporter TAXI family solute receptor|nr:ABC transporter substrate-binding protein [Zoogloeaceae bacterium]
MNPQPSRFRIKKPAIFDVNGVMEMFDIGPKAALAVVIMAFAVVVAVVVFFIRSAPPTSITISTGPEGGAFYRQAQRYAKMLETNGVKLKIVTSAGLVENLQKLADPKSGVDLAFVQGGADVKEIKGMENLVSLGSVSHQPVLIFHLGKLDLLADLKGRKIAIGPEGSGTSQLALTMLAANGIKPGEDTTLLNLDSNEALTALREKEVAAAFIMSESASTADLRALMRDPNIQLYSFRQVGAYARKYDYLDPLVLPEGGIDLGADLPAQDVNLLGPMIELAAKKDLHPAISDLILEAATKVHSRPGIYQQRNEFPAMIEHSIPLSEDAARYYKSGKSFLYRYLPYWLASLLSRILVVLLPAIVILVPVARTLPAILRWRGQIKIYQRYRELLNLERALVEEKDPSRKAELRAEFDRLEADVDQMQVKGRFADQLYALRSHIDYVRRMRMQ